jgi:hypothetical protein
MFGAIYAAEGRSPEAVLAVAQEFSPRVDSVSNPREIVLDLSGLTRLFGDARTIAEELRRTAADRGVQIRVAIAGTRTAARLMVRSRAGITVIEPGTEAAVLAPLPLALLGELLVNSQAQRPTPNHSQLPTPNWKCSSGGVCARSVISRRCRPTIWPHVLGRTACDGNGSRAVRMPLRWCRPFPKSASSRRSISNGRSMSSSRWPSCSGRLLEPLEAHLERRGRGAAVLHVRLFLVKAAGETRVVHERSLQLPTPIRDARTLRTLALLDLESHPPAGPIDRVVVAVDPTPARIVQFSLITRPLPSPEQISTLMARLQALMGETRCGSPALIDSWRLARSR